MHIKITKCLALKHKFRFLFKETIFLYYRKNWFATNTTFKKTIFFCAYKNVMLTIK